MVDDDVFDTQLDYLAKPKQRIGEPFSASVDHADNGLFRLQIVFV